MLLLVKAKTISAECQGVHGAQPRELSSGSQNLALKNGMSFAREESSGGKSPVAPGRLKSSESNGELE